MPLCLFTLISIFEAVYLRRYCWQRRLSLSTSAAAALFDSVLISRHIPQTVSTIDQHPASSSCHAFVSDDLLSRTSYSAFPDRWSCAKSQNADMSYRCRKPFAHDDDFLSEMASVGYIEHSDDNYEWPFVSVHDSHLPYLADRRLPVMEDFVAELKPHAPVSRGLILVDDGKSWDLLTARSTVLVKPGVRDDNPHVVEMSKKYKLPEQKKEVTLPISKVKSSVCSIEPCQKVVADACNADSIEADDKSSHLCPEGLGCDVSSSQCKDEGRCSVDSNHEIASYRCDVKPDFSVMCPKDEDSSQTRSDVISEHSAAAESEMIADVKCESRDSYNRLSAKLQDIGRIHSAEQLSEDKHSSHSVSQQAPLSHNKMKSASSQSISTSVFLDEVQRADESIYRRPRICRRDADRKCLDGYRMSVSHDNVADLNVMSISQPSERQGNAECRIMENRQHGLCWSEQHLAHLDTRDSDQEWSVKDVRTSSSHTRHHSCDQLPSSSLDKSKKLAGYYESPSIEQDVAGVMKALVEYVTVPTNKCNGEQLSRSAVVPVAVDLKGIEISEKKLTQPGSVKTLGVFDMHSSASEAERTTELDGDLVETNGGEDTAVVELTDSINRKRVTYKIRDATLELCSVDSPSQTTLDFEAENDTKSWTTANVVEQRVTSLSDKQTTSDGYESTLSWVKQTAESETSQIAVTSFNVDSQPVMTLITCDVAVSDVNGSEHQVASRSVSTVAVTELSDEDAATSTVIEKKDAGHSGETPAACDVSKTWLPNASRFGITTDDCIITLNDTSRSPSEPAVNSPNDESGLLKTTPDADDTANARASSEKIVDTSEITGTTLYDAECHGKTVSTFDPKTTELDDSEGARATPTADQVNNDDSYSVGNVVDSVPGTEVDSFLCALIAADDVSVEMFSGTSTATVTVSNHVADSAAETSASASAPMSDCSTAVIAADATDSHLAGTFTDDTEPGITAFVHTCQVIETCKEKSAESCHESDIMTGGVSNCRYQTVDWMVSDPGTAGREEFVKSVSCSDGVLLVPVRSSEMLGSVTDSPADVSSLSTDLSVTFSDSVSGPTAVKNTDHSEANQAPMSTASDKVNSEKCLLVCTSCACLITAGNVGGLSVHCFD